VSHTAIYGRLWTGDFELVTRILETWVAPGRLRTKIRISGEEIDYEDERLSFYCHNAAGNEIYLLEGETSDSLDAARAMLQRLLEIARGMNVTSTFEYVEVTESGEQVGEEFEVR
jgi:hypothetical protein